jgi:prevent-host-death family protein
MEKTTTASDARRTLGKILREMDRGDRHVVTRNGEPIAAIVPIKLYAQMKRGWGAFFDEMREVSERASLSEQEATALVNEAIAATRAQP